MATLYKDSKTGKYQEKKGKIILRQYQKNKLFAIDSYKGLGLYFLKLDEFVKNLGYDTCKSIELDLPLQNMNETYLKVIITTTLLKSTESNDETMSLGSFNSDASAIAATFAHFDIDNNNINNNINSNYDNNYNNYDNFHDNNEEMSILQLNRMSSSSFDEDLVSRLRVNKDGLNNYNNYYYNK